MVRSIRAWGAALILLCGAIFVVHGLLDEPVGDPIRQGGAVAELEPTPVRESEPTAERVEVAPSADIRDVAEVASASPQQAGGEIRGAVKLAESGLGLANVRIRITAVRGPEGTAGGGRPAEALLADDRASTHETSTDASGLYVFTGLAPGRWTIEASSSTHSIDRPDEVLPQIVETGSIWNFVARPMGRVMVIARLPGGRPAETFTIEIERALVPRRSVVKSTREGEPSVDLDPGEYDIRVSLTREQCQANEVASVCVSERKKVVIESGQRHALEFDLVGSFSISGTVRITDPSTTRTLLVQCVRVPPDQVAEPRLLESSGSVHMDRVHSKDLDYRLENLVAGRYLVGLSRDLDMPIMTYAVIELSDRDVIHDFETPPLDPKHFVRVTVTGSSGQPVDGASFSWRHPQRGFGEAESVSDGPGRYLLFLSLTMLRFFSESPEASGLSFTANHEEHGSVGVDVPRQPTELHFHYPANATLEVRINGYVGSALEGKIELSLGNVVAADDLLALVQRAVEEVSQPPDAFGVVRLGPIAVGSRLITVSRTHPTGNTKKLVLFRESIDLKPGHNELVLNLPPLHDLRVEVAGGESGKLFVVSVNGGEFYESREVFASTLRFLGLPAGRYDVLVSNGGRSAFASVTVNGDSTANLTLGEPNACLMQGLWTYPDLKKIPLKDGDLIVGIDGTLFGGVDAMTQALTAAASRSRVVVNVLRRGERFDLELNAPGFLKISSNSPGRFVSY